MTRTIYRALAALAIVFAFGIAPAAAQTGQMFGELVGRVTDAQGGALPVPHDILDGARPRAADIGRTKSAPPRSSVGLVGAEH